MQGKTARSLRYIKALPSSHELAFYGVFYLLPLSHRSLHMNTDQMKGAAKDAAGKVQEKVGQAVDSKNQEAKGLEKQAEGKVQKTYGDAKDTINKTTP
jgi:uncharacterized protein YjbJ (UPF0337 family)